MANVDVVSRKEFLDEFRRDYQPGQHVTALGPTGRGKSFLIGQCLAVVVSPELQVTSLHGKIKGRDPVVGRFADGLKLRSLPEMPSHTRQRWDRKAKKYNGYVIIPLEKALPKAEANRILRASFQPAMYANYSNRRRKTITHVNEAHQAQVDLKLRDDCEDILMRGAPDAALWSETQRGRYLSFHTYNAPEHFFVFYDDNREERKRYADFGCADPDEILYITSNLQTERVADGRTISQCLYIRRGGGMYVIDMH